MPQLRTLSPADVSALEAKRRPKRQRQQEQYGRLLHDFQLGDYGEVDLAPGETRITIRKQLRGAAQRRGLALTFFRLRGGVMRFQVEPRPHGNVEPAALR